MNNEDNPERETCEDPRFGVMGEILRALQKEELEQEETQQLEIQEIDLTKKIMGTLTEINTTLKELLETQKQILAEIKKPRLE